MGFQVILNHPHTRRLGRRHNTKGLSRLTRSTGAPNTMHIGIGISRQFEVNHHFQGGNIEPSGRDIAGHQNRAGIVCELQKHLIAISLLEVTVNSRSLYIVFAKETCHLGALLFCIAKNHRVSGTVVFKKRQQCHIAFMLLNLKKDLL